MTPLTADRYVPYRDGWIDVATGARVMLRLTRAGSTAEQLAWSHQCELLANLRHPALRPLIDFGSSDRVHRFEAWAGHGSHGSSRAPRATAERGLRRHASDFLASHGVVLDAVSLDVALRGGPERLIPESVAFRLCQRRALDALRDTIEDGRATGLTRLVLSGPLDSGLRTARTVAARAARIAGYVPVCPGALALFPTLPAELLDRHVCILADPDGHDSAALHAFVTRLGSASARRHLLIEFTREERRGAIRLEPLGVTAMTAMIYRHPQHGPAIDAVTRAARQAAGWPGAFLRELSGVEVRTTLTLVARETAPSFAARPLAVSDLVRERRTAGVLRRSRDRAARLVASGRHAGAARVLARAARLFAAQGAHDEAAQCALDRGNLLLDRALAEPARRAFNEARESARSASLQVSANVGHARARLLERRFADAEAALRAAIVAAGDDRQLVSAKATATAVLADCLCRQGRVDEAEVAMAGAAPQSDVECVRAAVHVLRGSLADAMTAARGARDLAGSDVRATVAAWHALATVHAAAGDRESALAAVETGIRAARQARLPIARLALEITAIANRLSVRPIPKAASLPPLLRADLGDALRRRDQPIPAQEVSPLPDDLEQLLEIAHATDDQAAVERICAVVLERLAARSVVIAGRPPERRLLAVAGKGWDGDPVAARVLAGERVVAPDPSIPPCVAAVPVRCGGELLAALACRFAPGAPVHPSRTTAVLKAAALAIAPAVRGVLDRVPAPSRPDATELLGDSACMVALRDAIARAARAPFPVLVQGESGSGKELVARAIHRLGPRRERRFCAVNCAALADDLLEAELFGHARGAYTGAVGERAGLFEDADGGTLFLDEVGELSGRAQAKLLRVLQDGEVRRIGETVARRVDVRVVAATNRTLDDETAGGRFRGDLKFRLDVVRIDVPPLRDRPGDVPMLALKFWHEATTRVGSQAALGPEILSALARYDWPGNVRELQNVIAWMAVHAPRRGRIGPSSLPARVAGATLPAACTFEAARTEFERRFVRAALASANGQRGRAADALGVTRQGLAKIIRRLGLEDGERRLS